MCSPLEIMEYDPDLANVLRELASGEMEPDDWIDWWERKSDWVASLIKRGQWLRLKPPQPGGFGPPCRCAFVSQSEACKLLDQWGVEYRLSDRYEEEWETHFREFCAQQEAERNERQKRFRPILKLLEPEFPRFARFLWRNLETIESMDVGASDEDLAVCQSSLNAALPAAYKRFLKYCRSVELGDTLRFGLPYTFVHESPAGPRLPTDGLLCFGDCWLEADGDQVLFGTSHADPPVFYYAHEIPELRQVASNFVEWVEGIPKWDSWEV
jgi:hypothetical protein